MQFFLFLFIKNIKKDLTRQVGCDKITIIFFYAKCEDRKQVEANGTYRELSGGVRQSGGGFEFLSGAVF